jgi:GT2 family glycosyltransferase
MEKQFTSTDSGPPFERDDNIDLSIIIPVFNNANFTKLALEGLTKLSNKYEIVIIDNNSTDNTVEMVEDFIVNTPKDRAKVVLVSAPINLGFGGSNNKAFKHARGRNILFLNNDIRIDDKFETWPEELVRLSEEGYIVCAQGGVLDKKFNFVKEGRGLPQTDYWYCSGWCLGGSRDTFDKLTLSKGNVHEVWLSKLFLYYEDVDLTWRAKKLGIPIKEIDVPIHHFGKMTGRKFNMFGYFKKSQKIFRQEWKEKYRP